MPFEMIENAKTLGAQIRCFPDGVRVEPRQLSMKGKTSRFIKITIGAELARKLVWRDDLTKIDLAFGTGKDAGKIRASVNLSSGQFVAKRNKSGCYVITINSATAEGLFALDFQKFDIPSVDPVCERGIPPALVFTASDEMLALAD